ncbi:RHS repeat-associated core domain-containing protein [Streptomyces coeruleoprunus]|uniref:RHS repeat-associated core domain-containing protein n=1 Tax=Streptomyces coeruleoprunus TaxID=285563 RepID=A0ABV9XEA2_9ACTN
MPETASARVDLSRSTDGKALAVAPTGIVDTARAGARARNAVVSVAPAAAPGRPSVSEVDVRVLGHEQVKAAGGIAVGARLLRSDGASSPGALRLSIDYDKFRHLYGGDFASRLRLVRLPACALTTPHAKGCAERTYIPATNDVKEGTLTATVQADPDPDSSHNGAEADGGGVTTHSLDRALRTASTTTGSVYTLASGSSSDGGDYRATQLNPSGSWDVSVGSGAFTYSLPIQLPNPPMGTAPSLSLQYNSQNVDGRTSATNNQGSWVGMGWNLGVGFIERKYRNCSDDGLAGQSIYDLCWDSPNSAVEPDGAVYIINLNGVTSQLIQDRTGDGSYHVQDDPGWRVQHITSGGHGSVDSYWVVSHQDGTRYYFGWGRSERTQSATNSVLTVPVVSNDSGEPCWTGSIVTSVCTMGWRWGLDRTVDPSEVETSYFYDKEKNWYRSTVGTDQAREYDAASYLKRVEYGWASQIADAKLPARVVFQHVNRCTERTSEPDPLGNPVTTDCPSIATSPSSYPDVPTDLICDGSADPANACAGKTYYPTFFHRDMLWDINTQIWDDATATWLPVMQYQMKYAFTNGTGANNTMLWLDYVQRKAYGNDPNITLPTIDFHGVDKDNLVGSGTLQFRRIDRVYGDLGAVTDVTYGRPDPCDTAPSSQSSNTKNCYWQKWIPEGATDERTGWFHKYLVTKVQSDPGVGVGSGHDGDPVMTTTYDYHGGAGWRFTNDPLVPDVDETWSDWRGYAEVTVSKGANKNASSVHHWLYRGLDSDRTSKTDPALKRSVTVKDTFGGTHTDSAWLAGHTLETSTRDHNREPQERTVYDYWVYTTARYEGLPDARFVRKSKTTTHTKVSTTIDSLESTWREHIVTQEFDNTEPASTTFGLPMRTHDWGETGVSDNQCTIYGRAYNRSKIGTTPIERFMALEDHTRHYAAGCSAANLESYKDAETMVLYDGATSLTTNVPTDGKPTEVRSYAAEGQYRFVRHTYDQAGRVVSDTDALGNTTTTTYRPDNTWPTDGVVTTTADPDGTGPGTPQTTTNFYSRFWGELWKTVDANNRTTKIDLDAAGRTVAVWLPSEYGGANPSMKFSYTLHTATKSDGVPRVVDQAPKVISHALQSGSTYSSSTEFIDGLGRTRETQTPSPDKSGLTVVSTRYDSSGNVTGVSSPFYHSNLQTLPADGMVKPRVADLPSYNDVIVDWAGRKIESRILVNGQAQTAGHTRTVFTGADHIATFPALGQPTETYTDVYGHPTKVVEHTATQAFTSTYSYPHGGQLTEIRDAQGNLTRRTYNWAGDLVSTEDPDAGTTRTTYNAFGEIETTTDANGTVLSYDYDNLHRPLRVRQGTTVLNSRSYDTAPGGIGLLASATSYDGTHAYTTSIGSYDHHGRALSKTLTIPADGSGLDGQYTFQYEYDAAGNMTAVTYPAVAGLPSEKVTATYTDQGRASRLTGTLGTTVYVDSTSYDNYGRLTGRAYGAGGTAATRSYTYDDNNGTRWLNNITTGTTAGGTVQSDTYTRNANGSVTALVDNTAAQRQCFDYDDLHRLTAAWTTGSATACAGSPNPDFSVGPDPYQQSFTYDSIGNVTSRTTATGPTNATTRTYHYPAAGSPRPHAVTSVDRTGGSDLYSYDLAGQLQTRSVLDEATGAVVPADLVWNAQHHLVRFTAKPASGDKVTRYVYDADGQLLMRTSPNGNVLYLGDQEIHKSTTGTPVATRYYKSGDSTVAMRVADGASGKLTWLMADHQASTQLGIDAVTGAVTRRRYLPFGGQRGSTSLPAGTTRGFLGKPEDPSTGFDILGARAYDPVLGRFLSPDPIQDPAQPQQWNAYAYAGNNPANSSDPSGLLGIPDPLMAEAVEGAGKVFAAVFTQAVDSRMHALGNYVLKPADPYFRKVMPERVIGTDSDPTAVRLGWEWATGTGPKKRSLDGDSRFTQTLQRHHHVQSARQDIAWKAESGKLKMGSSGRKDYSLGSWGLFGLYRDFVGVGRGLAAPGPNQPAAFLGSYILHYTITGVDRKKGTVTIDFRVSNESTINSAVHTSPAIGGYGDWWEENIAKDLDRRFGTEGVMSLKKQEIRWTETVDMHYPEVVYTHPGSGGGGRGGGGGGSITAPLEAAMAVVGLVGVVGMI